MGAGRIIADGTPDQILTADRLKEVFHLKANIVPTPHGPLVQPLGVIQ
jgi:iron complex transport system ATP-binding protein